jgi:histidyl-tRNA synthetase
MRTWGAGTRSDRPAERTVVSQTIRAPRGVKDILPPDARRFESILRETEEILLLGGFQKVLLPIFESVALFTRSIGDETDIVEKEMYTFQDKGGDVFALRPEGTASLLRAAIEHRLADQSRLSRLYYSGPMFRHERPQAGRLRQFHQVGAEILGPLTPSDDVDLIALVHRMATQFRIPDWTLLLNNMGCPMCRPAYREALVAYLKSHFEELCPSCQRRTGTNPLRVLDCKVPSCQPILEKAPKITDFLCERSRVHYDRVKEELDILGIPFKEEPRLVRGLDYYTETTFEFTSGALGAQSTWAAGGRYDGLSKDLGGPDMPGVGFAAGIERLWLLREAAGTLPGEGLPPVWVTVFPLAPVARPQAIRLVTGLREAGIPAVGLFSDQKIKAAFRQAERDRSRFLAFIGEDELQSDTVQIKDLVKGEQVSFPLGDTLEMARRIRMSLLPGE